MAARYYSHDISSLTNRTFFFDANILLYLYYDYQNNQSEVIVYSKMFGSLLTSKSQLLIDTHVLSEFVNRTLRIEFDNFKTANQSNMNFKQYRNSVDGQSSTNRIFDLVKVILNQFVVEENNLSNSEIQSLLVVDSLDFNDKIIEKHCLDKKYILVTHDKDFKNSPVDILTANRKL